MSRFLVEKHKGLKPYTPGEQPGDMKYIKLNTNESPFPPSAEAIRLASAELEKLMLYPDPDCRELTAMLAREYGVSENMTVLGNGSDEILNFAFMAFADDSCPAIFPDITYGFYKVFASLNGIPYTEIPLKDDFTIDVNDYISTRGTVFIANPNAPTGIALPLSDIERILESDRERVVVVDEAYVDFGGESAVSLLPKYDNLLVVGTFSKSRSMAGARLGFGIGNPELISDLQKIRYSTNPYNVNRMTAAAGYGALSDKEYFKSNCESIVRVREWVMSELFELGFTLTESKTNFVFAKSDRIGGEELYLALRKRGILVRHFSAPRISEYNRITIGSDAEMQILVSTIKEILELKK